MNLVGEINQLNVFRKHFPVEYLDIQSKKVTEMFDEYEGLMHDKLSIEYLWQKCKIMEYDIINNPNSKYGIIDLQLITDEILRR